MIDHITDIGVYPLKVIGGEGSYEQRTERMEGWNDAASEVLRRYAECARPDWTPPKHDDDY